MAGQGRIWSLEGGKGFEGRGRVRCGRGRGVRGREAMWADESQDTNMGARRSEEAVGGGGDIGGSGGGEEVRSMGR